MRLQPLLFAIALVPTLLVAVACGDDDDGDEMTPQPTAGTPATTASPGATVPSPAATATFEGGTTPVEKPAVPTAGAATLTAVRAATHEGYDRIVFEFAEGDAIPGYSVRYEDAAVQCGSGEDVTAQLGGGSPPAAILHVDLRPANAHNEAGQATAEGELAPGLPAIKRVLRTCDFEAVVVYSAAVAAEAPFRVSELAAPPRLVVDIAN